MTSVRSRAWRTLKCWTEPFSRRVPKKCSPIRRSWTWRGRERWFRVGQASVASGRGRSRTGDRDGGRRHRLQARGARAASTGRGPACESGGGLEALTQVDPGAGRRAQAPREGDSRRLHPAVSPGWRCSPEVSRRGRTRHTTDRVSKLGEIRLALERLANDAQDLSRDLHPPTLETLGLEEALRVECESFFARTGLRVAFSSHEGVPEPATEVGLVFYRVTQEALRNALSHAQADEVRVSLKVEEDELVLEVEDSGVGFDPEAMRFGPGLGITRHDGASQIDRRATRDSVRARCWDAPVLARAILRRSRRRDLGVESGAPGAQLPPRVDDPAARRRGELGGVRGAELGHQALPVGLNGLRADTEALPDLVRRQARPDSRKDLELTTRERGDGIDLRRLLARDRVAAGEAARTSGD